MLLALLLAGCGSHATVDIAIPFASVAAGQPLGCGDPAVEVGSPPGPATAQFLELYVSDVAVVKDGTTFPVALTPDGEYQSDAVALVDLGDATGDCLDSEGTHPAVVGTVSKGAIGWSELLFSVGVPNDLDHLDIAAAEPPLDDPELWWSWTLGYKFMRWELATATVSGEWQLHLGSGECTGSGASSSCRLPNRPAIDLELADGDTVAVDAAALAAGSDLSSGGCFSDDVEACGPPFAALGLPFEGGAAPLQTVFARQ